VTDVSTPVVVSELETSRFPESGKTGKEIEDISYDCEKNNEGI